MIENVESCIQQGKSVCLTGPAGTGKSFIVDKLKEKYQEKMIVTASTGLAAMNIKGMTIHSYTGMGTCNHTDQINQVIKKEDFKNVARRIFQTDIHVIDEISMISGEQLDLIDLIFRKAVSYYYRLISLDCLNDLETVKKYETLMKEALKKPFGGKLMIFTGDFLQLPPVADENCYKKWAFQSSVWQELKPEVIILKKIWRQNNADFQEVLNQIRWGRCTGKIEKVLKTRFLEAPNDAIKLSSTNKIVDSYNEEQLNLIDSDDILIKGSIDYHHSLEEETDENIKQRKWLLKKLLTQTLVPYDLRLRKKCKIMILENHEKGLYVNGSAGIFEYGVSLLDTNMPKYSMVLDYINEFVCIWSEEEIKKSVKSASEFPRRSDLINLYPSDIELGVFEVHGKKEADMLKKLIEKYCTTVKGHIIKTVNLKKALKIKLDDNKKRIYLERSDKNFFMSGNCFDKTGKFTEIDIKMTQFPVKLGYAVTIHKSQGMTLSKLDSDFKKTFAAGQVYVALSRAKSLDGLYIKNFYPSMVFADIDAVNFYKDNEREE